ncbi:hypothetical protein [Streptomyces sp. NPDC003077]|uniref:hypothetical protein n=1 Tax=Streptomyces sp. NPDC003077 TaxID=3154443 RepID=UPI0033B00CB9
MSQAGYAATSKKPSASPQDDLLSAQDALQSEANAVVSALGLDRTLRALGDPVRTGSSALGLMAVRDIDITVVCARLDAVARQAVLRLGAELGGHPRVREVTFRNDTGRWNAEPTAYPDGLYLRVLYRADDAPEGARNEDAPEGARNEGAPENARNEDAPQGAPDGNAPQGASADDGADGPQGEWNLDIWFVDEPERQPDLAHLRSLPPRLTQEARIAILRIKRHLVRSGRYGRDVRSFAVYRAVLDGGVRTPDEFEQWRETDDRQE